MVWEAKKSIQTFRVLKPFDDGQNRTVCTAVDNVRNDETFYFCHTKSDDVSSFDAIGKCSFLYHRQPAGLADFLKKGRKKKPLDNGCGMPQGA